jgi:hypothetical protein
MLVTPWQQLGVAVGVDVGVWATTSWADPARNKLHKIHLNINLFTVKTCRGKSSFKQTINKQISGHFSTNQKFS